MLQRKQSLFLLFASIGMLLLFVFPYWEIRDPQHQMLFSGFSVTSNMPNQEFLRSGPTEDVFQLLLTLLISLASFAAILVVFMYKNRIKQAGFCVLIMVLQVMTGLVAGLMVIKTESALVEAGAMDLESGPQPGALIPLLMLIFSWMARRSILKDEALVKSMDRIR